MVARDESRPLVLFRCDGTSATGLGHTSRCLALAEALEDSGCRCAFIGHFEEPARKLLDTIPCESPDATSWTPDDARAVATAAKRSGACGIVVDSYVLGPDYVAAVERDAAPVLLVDDFAALPSYDCSALVNFTSRAEEYAYPRDRVRCYLGLSWFLARRPLRQLRAKGAPSVADVQRVLVAAGGNDTHDIILPVVEALQACDPRLSLHVVVGARFAARDDLSRLLEKLSGESVVLSGLPNLVGELSWADACISGAGLTKYEMAYVGKPAAVLSQNEGQARDTDRFEELGLVINLGGAASIDRVRLRDRVARLLGDRTLRESLRTSGLRIFPNDPTRALAEAALANVFTR